MSFDFILLEIVQLLLCNLAIDLKDNREIHLNMMVNQFIPPHIPIIEIHSSISYIRSHSHTYDYTSEVMHSNS